jgi:hypothetical protein
LEVARKAIKCLHFYFYYIDPELGFLHVRLESWFPFTVQVWMNGREWLARQLDREGIGYERRHNAFLRIDDLARAQQLCERLVRRKWPRLLNGLARKINPMLPVLRAAGFGGYYWVIDQAEFATDLMFRNRTSLEAIYPELVSYAMTTCGARDVMRFLGRKLHGNFRGEVTTDIKHRTEGIRIKHTLKRNSLKMYDKWTVLRIEVTINNPCEFKVLRVIETRRHRRSRRWMPMGKGVAKYVPLRPSERAGHLSLSGSAGAHATSRQGDPTTRSLVPVPCRSRHAPRPLQSHYPRGLRSLRSRARWQPLHPWLP